MDLKEETICRLCFKSGENDYVLIDDVVKEMLDVLLLPVDITISKNPALCTNCMHVIRRSYRFKKSCLDDTEMPIASFSGSIKHEKVDRKGEDKSEVVKDVINCELCKEVKTTDCVSIDKLFKDPEFSEQLTTFIPEKKFNFTENSIMCTTCKDDLQCYLMFAQRFLKIEEKINTYCQDVDSTDTVELIDVQNFLQNYKNETSTSEHSNEHSLEPFSGIEIDKDQVGVKVEEVYLKTSTDVQSNNKDESDILYHVTNEYPSKLYDITESETQEVKEELDDEYVQETIEETEEYQDHKTKSYECTICLTKLKTKGTLKRHQLTIHHLGTPKENESSTCRCKTCGFTARSRDNLQSHLLSHNFEEVEGIFQCSRCTFKVRHKRDILQHMIIHVDELDVETHKCPLCPFRSIYKETLNRHMVTHKSKDEVKVYKCESCKYETKNRAMLENHTLSHTSTGGLYNCDKCPYKTMLKRYYDSHMLSHLDLSDKAHKCPTCSFETKYKYCLKAHVKSHKKKSGKPRETTNKVSESEVFKCLVCSYETVRKSNLKRHMLLHKDKSETEVYKCANCTYETRYKSSMARHQLIHMHESETEKFKCSECEYESKWKSQIYKHLTTAHVT